VRRISKSMSALTTDENQNPSSSGSQPISSPTTSFAKIESQKNDVNNGVLSFWRGVIEFLIRQAIGLFEIQVI